MVGLEKVEEEPPSIPDLRDMFPGMLGWDWKNQEIIPSVWASIKDIDTNGWKITREPAPPPLPPKPTSLPQPDVQEDSPSSPGLSLPHLFASADTSSASHGITG